VFLKVFTNKRILKQKTKAIIYIIIALKSFKTLFKVLLSYIYKFKSNTINSYCLIIK
jgi:hypothetical protein